MLSHHSGVPMNTNSGSTQNRNYGDGKYRGSHIPSFRRVASESVLRLVAFLCLTATLGLLGAGCDDKCSGSTPIPVILTVSNAATGQPICDATVILTGPLGAPSTADAGALLVEFVQDGGGSEQCAYGVAERFANGAIREVSPLETEGNYQLTVSKVGFTSITQSLTVGFYGGCSGPIPGPAHVNVALSPG